MILSKLFRLQMGWDSLRLWQCICAWAAPVPWWSSPHKSCLLCGIFFGKHSSNQSLFLFGQGVVCPKAPGRDREAVLVTLVGLLWWMLTLGITRLPLFPAHQQDWLSWETQTSIKPSRWVFRHYLPVRAKACLAFMWKFKSWCQPAVLRAWSQGPIKHLLLSHAFILLLSSTKALQAPSVHRWHVSSQV